MKSGVELIAEERLEQILKHGRTIERDVEENCDYQLRLGALGLIGDRAGYYPKPAGWDRFIWDKMQYKSYKERLIVAGALIAAEIDRIQEADKDKNTEPKSKTYQEMQMLLTLYSIEHKVIDLTEDGGGYGKLICIKNEDLKKLEYLKQLSNELNQ